MTNRKWAQSAGSLRSAASVPLGIAHFVFSILILSVITSGCASPSEPYERKPLVPQAITDLAAARSGNNVVLSFTLPNETTDRRPLDDPVAIEIYRDFESSAGAGGTWSAPVKPSLLVAIPASMASRYSDQGRVHYTDTLGGENYAQHAGTSAVYVVRTRASEKKPSANSNAVAVSVQPAPEPIEDLKTEVTPTAIVLTWTPPKPIDDSTPVVAGYRIYRGEADPAATVENPQLKSPLAGIGESGASSLSFRDAQFDFGKTYAYSVRSFTQSPGRTLESAASNLAIITPHDTFPPAAPQGLATAFVPAQGNVPAHIELSWAISPETDLAGYNVYRTEQSGSRGTLLDMELLLTPAFRDMNVQPGRAYLYSVTAVDSSGNESPSSVAVSSGVPAENQPTP
jgi:hypothetical protein